MALDQFTAERYLALLSSPTWFRLVVFCNIGNETEWDTPRFCLRVDGDGPLMVGQVDDALKGKVLAFPSVQDALWWVVTNFPKAPTELSDAAALLYVKELHGE